MENRKKSILSAVIREYVDNAEPISSSTLVKKYNFNLSPATIRNEMMALEKEGYIFQPHTSAGRMPTDKGYRFYVDALMKKKALSEREQHSLCKEFLELKAKYNQLARVTAKLLSAMSHSLAISGFLGKDEACDCGMTELLKEPEFHNTEEVYKIASITDHLDENINQISKKIKKNSLEIYIGKENPIIKTANCSMIISEFKLASGDCGLIAIIGPKRMKYAKNISLVDYLTRLLASGGLMIFIILSF
jgi:transcriptional regulator of heat shock response